MSRTYADTIEDIKDVMAFTGCTENEAILALLDTGSIDEAIAQIRAQYLASEQYTRDEIARIQARIDSGYYDSTGGLRPDAVFVDRDGDIAISYPGGPDWIRWETKVAKGLS